MRITLPFPPSVNTYWRRNGHIYFISKQGKQFRKDVLAIVAGEYGMSDKPFFTGNVEVVMRLFPPTKRKSDVDNFPKAVFDALAKANVFEDDCQVKRMTVEMHEKLEGGACTVEISTLTPTA